MCLSHGDNMLQICGRCGLGIDIKLSGIGFNVIKKAFNETIEGCNDVLYVKHAQKMK